MMGDRTAFLPSSTGDASESMRKLPFSGCERSWQELSSLAVSLCLRSGGHVCSLQLPTQS
eukprot:scaffold9048_cov31-Tisochrysis_lutea.AAC.4